MAKLPRVTNKLYGSEIELEDIGQFGSAKSGNKVNTKDIPTIQGDEAWKKGWTHATMSSNKYPTRQERNGMDYSFSYQIDYLLREGLPEYDAGTEYNKGSMVKQLDSQNKIVLYQSLIDNNIGLDLSNPDGWQEIRFSGGGLEIGDIGMSLYVDESKGLRRYLNGQTVNINSNTQAFLNRLLQIKATSPSLFCSNEDWEAARTVSAFGQVGKFVFNYADDGVTIESVRLPRVVNVQGLFDLSNLGMTVSAGLPNITGQTRMIAANNVGMYYHPDSDSPIYGSGSATGQPQYSSGGTTQPYLNFDASRSNSIYGKSDTVQPEAIQYPYFIQIATGAETKNNIVNEIELNNPFSFGDSKYSPIELNNISWLKSTGQWNSKAVYPDYYNWVLENVNNEVEGFKTSTAEDITDYDFVINTADETFRLPIKSWLETSTDGLYLYFYVGETVQNANLIDAGRVMEMLAGKTDSVSAANASMPSDKYIALTLGASGSTYIAPADGWYVVTKNSGASGTYLNIYKNNTYWDEKWEFNNTSKKHTVNCPAYKGEKVIVNFTMSGATQFFRFYYAQGAVSFI